MSDTTINEPNSADQPKPLFEVGGRSYDSDAAQKKILNADSHIVTLEQERKGDQSTIEQLQAQLAEANSKLENSTKLDQVIEKMNMQAPTSSPEQTAQGIDVEQLRASMLEQANQAALTQVQQFESNKIQEANQLDSISAAKAVFGTDYEAKLRATGAEMGLNDEGIQTMAKSNPVLFKQAFGLNKQQTNSAYPNNGLNTNSFEQHKMPKTKSTKNAWSVTDRINTQLNNEAEIANFINKECGGDATKAAQLLGIKLTNFA
jgi:hypothetical protein